MTLPASGTNIKLSNFRESTDSAAFVLGYRDTPFGNRTRYRSTSSPSGKDILYSRGKTMNSENRLKVISTNAQQDVLIDSELGDVLRKVAAKFGKDPFIKAYKRALDASKTINDRRKKCLEEDIRLRSVLRAGDD